MTLSASRLWLRYNSILAVASAVLVAMFVVFLSLHPRGLSVGVVTTSANKGVLLALVAMAQVVPVITRGLDLSVGSVMVLSACVASVSVNGDHVVLGILAVTATGLACGLCNGVLVVVGRLQPIVATLGTSAIFQGLALLIRPSPGGEISDSLSEAVTEPIFGAVPASLVLLAGILIIVWIPFRKSTFGQACYAAGSSEGAAILSGVPVGLAKTGAYVLAGFFAAMAGLLLSLVTLSAEASATQAGLYTLNSIAAVVIGGTLLSGGVGGAASAIVGAFLLRTIGDLLFVFKAPALWQPLFEGLILLLAIGLASIHVLHARSRLAQFG